MPINPNIALAVKAPEIQIPNALAQAAQVAQLRNYDIQAQEAQAALEERNRLRALNPQAADYEAQLFRVNPQLGIAYRKERTAAEASEAARQKSLIEAASAKQGMLGQAMRDISQRPSDANITAHLEDVLASPLFSPEEKAAVQKRSTMLLGMPFTERGTFLASQGAKAGELKPHFAQQTLGGTVRQIATPAFGGEATVVPGSQAAVTMTPSEAANVGLRAQEVGLRGREVNLREEEAQLKREGIEGISPKELQKRNAALPQAKSSVESFESKTDSFIKDLEKLRDDPGLDQITGPVYGRTPSVSREGSRAQAQYNKIFAKGGFQALQDLREASKTGGALGNVSNEEGRRLERSIVGGLDRTQNIADVKQGINDLIEDLKVSKARVRNTFDETYSYRNPQQTAAPAAPAAALPPGFKLDK